VERRTGKVQLTLVWNTDNFRQATPVLPRLVQQLKSMDKDNSLWHSIWVNFRTGPGNAILSRGPGSFKKLAGLDYVVETIGKVRFYFTPLVFRQANLGGFEQIIKRVEVRGRGGSGGWERWK